MTERLTLSSAELSFILAQTGDDVRQAGYQRLAIAADEQTVPVRRAGLASLLLRGLARADNERYELAPAVSAVFEGLTTARVTAQIGFIGSDRADGTFLFDTGAVRFFLAPRAHHCFDVVGLDTSVALRAQLQQAAAEFLRDNNPGVVSIVVDPGWPTRQRLDGRTVSVAANADSWSFIAGGPGNEEKTLGLTPQSALAKLSESMLELLPGPADLPR